MRTAQTGKRDASQGTKSSKLGVMHSADVRQTLQKAMVTGRVGRTTPIHTPVPKMDKETMQELIESAELATSELNFRLNRCLLIARDASNAVQEVEEQRKRGNSQAWQPYIVQQLDTTWKMKKGARPASVTVVVDLAHVATQHSYAFKRLWHVCVALHSAIAECPIDIGLSSPRLFDIMYHPAFLWVFESCFTVYACISASEIPLVPLLVAEFENEFALNDS
ncbi:9008_t:CDS:2 [Acaulospora colombiana]|uniref:9008_t:CDS:1 n=1 Tax=Acaulospora colombiana TaxID=27376 RepID=A0ACA9M5R8_9GLOM|nr:9008_t:CDS:2 [Acaulospora colombiana]